MSPHKAQLWLRNWLAGVSPTRIWIALLALAATLPVWVVRHAPLEDLAFHGAAIRVIHSFSDESFGLQAHYVLNLARTQYLLYYFAGSVLSYVMSPHNANRVLISVYLAGTPLAIAALCRVLRRDERLALLSIPILYNAMYIFGLASFLFGVPLAFWGLAAFVWYVDRPTIGRGALALGLALATFYSHLFPFAILGLGCVLLFPWNKPHRYLAAITPYLPLAVVVLVFLFGTQTGELARQAVSGQEQPLPLSQAMAYLWTWSGSVYRDNSDEATWIAWFMLAIVAGGLSVRSGQRRARGLALVLLPALCLGAYFMLPQSRGVVWLYCQRFPALGMLCLVPCLRMPRGALGVMVTGLAAGLAVFAIGNACRLSRACEAEIGDVDGAIENIPPGKTVAALIYARDSKYIEWSPYLHFGSYYQVERGGLLQFSFAPWPHWPFAYREGAHPEIVSNPPKRWEWQPEQRDVRRELLPNYEYVLVKGKGFAPPAGTYTQTWSGKGWSVWHRLTGPQGAD